MKRYDYILFDLDGTITDPAEGITNSIIYALEKLKIKAPPREELYKFIGPPLVDSFMKYYSMTAEQAWTAVEYYREYFREKGLFENRVYDGFGELLEELNASGKALAVATSKPEEFSVRILEHFGLAQYFYRICGANTDGTRSSKSEVIEYTLKSCAVTDKSRVIMVGDRKYDIEASVEHGIDSVGVLFGYGSKQELTDAKATYIAADVKELREILSGRDE